jgi:hypothetical protein
MKFQETFCSQCGEGFGPGDSGYSSCKSHSSAYIPTDYARGIDDGMAILLKKINSALNTDFIDAGEATAYLFRMRIKAEFSKREAE